MYDNDRWWRQVRRPLFDLLPDRIRDLGYSVIRLTHKAKGAFIGPNLGEIFHAVGVLFRELTPVLSGLGLRLHREVNSVSACE